MKSRIFVLFAMLLLSFSVTAEMQTHSEAMEVAASDVRLPQSDSGTIAFKQCEECDYQTEPVSAGTVWLLNDKATTLAKFRAAMARIANRNEHLIVITQSMDDQGIVEVSMWDR